MKNRKNILLIIPNLDAGGAQRSFAKLSVELSKKHNVYVGVFNTYSGIAYPLGGQLIDLDVPGGGNWFSKLLNFTRRVRKLREVKKKFNIDTSISFLEGADYVNILSRRNDKIIFSIRGSKMFDETIKGVIGRIRKKILINYFYSKADVIVTVNEGISQELSRYFGLKIDKCKVIYNFYNIDEIRCQSEATIDEQLLILFHHPVLAFSGRLAIEKGINHLLSVFTKVKKMVADVKFLIIGDGPMKESLLILCRELELSAYTWDSASVLDDSYDIYFIGPQENPFNFIRKSTLFLMASSSEGFPNAMAEAMICGVPVVSTDCPSGPREILAPATNEATMYPEMAEFGVLMPLFSEGAIDAQGIWAETIVSLLRNDSVRLSYAKKSEERMNAFKIEYIFQEWETII